MPFCPSCGVELPDNAQYCTSCGSTVSSQRLITVPTQATTTNWVYRCVAWLIDVIILSLAIWPIQEILRPLGIVVPDVLAWIPFVSFGIENVIYFGYWTFMEGTYGQSIGKMMVGLKVTSVRGASITYGQAAIQSLGKAICLPLDWLVGWFLYPNANQRFFNHLSNTTVVSSSDKAFIEC
jgi:uncharacterized RDD family membrane protein YckC